MTHSTYHENSEVQQTLEMAVEHMISIRDGQSHVGTGTVREAGVRWRVETHDGVLINVQVEEVQ